MRKDGRPLVTDFPVTAMDMIDYTPPSEVNLPEGIIRCSLGPVLSTVWMDDGILPDEEDDSIWIP